MGGMLYISQGLKNSPYKHLLDDIHWVNICDLFTREACHLLELPVQSPLSIMYCTMHAHTMYVLANTVSLFFRLNAGTVALPALLNIRQVMQVRNVMSAWGQNDELPVSPEVEAYKK